jgi:hypothetical protein
MTLRTMARTVLASSLVAVALFSGIGPRAVPPVLAATTTTINFDDLAAGTSVTNQYEAKGVDFTGDILPFVDQVDPSLANSGNQVADISQCSGCEFFTPNIHGSFINAAQHVSVRVGYFANSSNPGDTATMTLTAYDSGGNPITSDSQTVTEGQGFRTLLSVSSASADIASFQISGTPNSGKVLGIDDLTFDNPGGVPPDFSLSPTASLVNVNQGSSATDNISINRLNGSTGDLTFSAGNLPSGMTASFSPNPAGSATTMTVSAPANFPPTGNNPPHITVTATPDNPSAGTSPRSVDIFIQVQASFYVTIRAADVKVPPCSDTPVKVDVNYTSGFTGNVTLSAAGLPANMTGVFHPATVGPPTDGGRVSTSSLTLTTNSDVKDLPAGLTVTGKSGQLTSTSIKVLVSRVPPSITSVNAPAWNQTPQALENGSPVVIIGHGFCPGTTVAFGNQLATATPINLAPEYIGVPIPRLATTGKIYVIPPGGSVSSAGTAVSPAELTVDSYRNIGGFSFRNSTQFQSNVGGYSFSDVSDVFGYDQTHVGVNPCWPLGNCSFYTPIPDPFALLFWAIVNHFGGGNGQCFGFSLASQRLLHGDQTWLGFPEQHPALKSVWNLQGPDLTGGPSPEVSHFIHLTHMEQFSGEALHDWWTQATANAAFGTQSSIIDQVSLALSRHDHPLIEIRNGLHGHVVVAYDVENGANGDKLIDVYDPNQEFSSDENSPDGTAHQAALTNSRITIHSNGHWEFPGNGWHSGLGSLVVVPYGVVPVHPTMPFTKAGLLDFFFGSASSSQVTDASGHTLLKPNGDINSDPKTGIPGATRFAALSAGATSAGDIFLLGRGGAYTQTIIGKGAGQYHDSLFGSGMAASLTATSGPGLTDKVSLLPQTAGLQFGQTTAGKAGSARKVTAQILVHAADGSARNASVDTTMPAAGKASINFDPAYNSITVKAGSRPASYSLTLSRSGANGAPQTFVTPRQTIGPGETAKFTPASWSSLQGAAVTLKVVHKNGTTTTTKISNVLRPAGQYSLRLQVVKTPSHGRKLTIAATFKRLVKGASAVVSWQIFKGKQIAGHHSVSLVGKKLHTGLISSAFVFKPAKGKKYMFQGTVTLLSPTKTGSFLSQTANKQKSFRG